jgi:heme-degrading monooxygenase HmoA
VLTEWASEEAFREWVDSDAFRKGHARAAGPGGPVATHAELLEFEVALSAGRHREGPDSGHEDGQEP